MHEGDLIQVVRSLKAGQTDIAVTYDIYLDGGVEFAPLFETSPHVIISERDPLADKSTFRCTISSTGRWCCSICRRPRTTSSTTSTPTAWSRTCSTG